MARLGLYGSAFLGIATFLFACDNGGENPPNIGEPTKADGDAGANADAEATGVASCTSAALRPGAVSTTSGAFTGTKVGSTWTWKGIPYAAPPTGALRWQPPAPFACQAGERAATSFGPKCPQIDKNDTFVGEEDCLTLNVFAPEGLKDAPVLVFVHGGGNTQGTASDPIYDGTELATRTGSVVVTLEYRLGALGFFAHTKLDEESAARAAGAKVSGNYGILDQVAALQWVKANVAAFGGTPSKVLLFGESAGAQDTLVHVASPLSKGLFSAAIVQSGGVYTTTLEKGEKDMQALVDGVSCTSAPDVIACMRALTPDKLVMVPNAHGPLDKSAFRYTPVIDGYVLKGSAAEVIAKGEHNRVPLVVGTNADETGQMAAKVTTEDEYKAAVKAQYGTFADALLKQYPASKFATPRKALVRLTTDVTWTCPARRLLRSASQNQTEPVFRYYFSWTTGGPNGAAVHGLELLFVFRTFGAINDYQPKPADEGLSTSMQEYWSTLAATGDPKSTTSGIAWPRYDAVSDPYLDLGTAVGAKAGISTADCDYIDALLKE